MSHEPFDLRRTIVLFSEPNGNGIHIGIERVETVLIKRPQAAPAQGDTEADNNQTDQTSDNRNGNST